MKCAVCRKGSKVGGGNGEEGGGKRKKEVKRFSSFVICYFLKFLRSVINMEMPASCLYLS